MKIWIFIWDGDGGTGARAFTTLEAAEDAFWTDAEASGYDRNQNTYEEVFEGYCDRELGVAWVEETELEGSTS